MILFTAPYKSQSGYGFKSREILNALFEEYKDDLYVDSTPWGANPNNEIMKEENKHFLDLKSAYDLPRQPEMHIHVGIPEDFKPHGKKNILFTSGVETDKISPEWVQKLNEIPNLEIIVPSKFTKDVMMTTKYILEKDGKKEELNLQQPVYVISESYSDSLFLELNEKEEELYSQIMDSIGDDKFFFSAGQAVPEKLLLNADRKGFHDLVSAFWTVFSDKDNVTLLLKVNGVDNSEITYNQFKQVFDDIKWSNSKDDNDYESKASVKLLKGFIPSNVLFKIMSHENNLANVYPTRGEGFGRMILESSLTGNKLIVPEVGAFRDFTRASFTEYMEGSFKDIPEAATMNRIIISGSKWYYVQPETIMGVLKETYRNGKDELNLEKVEEDISELKSKFHLDTVKKSILEFVDQRYIKMVDLSDKKPDEPNIKIPRLKKSK